MRNEVIEFNGIKYRRYPESENRTDRVYFSPGIADRQRGVGRLHQEVWKSHYGEIPEGHHIHHIDGAPLNNDITNLQCLPYDEHLKEHPIPGGSPEHMARIQELAKEWHGSAEGRAWHSEHAKRNLALRAPISKSCEQCGAAYEDHSIGGSGRFCSNKCKAKWRRDAKIDHEERTCEICGSSFTANKYDKARTCSRSCGFRLRTLSN